MPKSERAKQPGQGLLPNAGKASPAPPVFEQENTVSLESHGSHSTQDTKHATTKVDHDNVSYQAQTNLDAPDPVRMRKHSLVHIARTQPSEAKLTHKARVRVAFQTSKATFTPKA